ncbi:homocysteine S-methyltransferase family protein [Clostridium sp. KNHs205]|uniref:homocysteine S-methyltransferase family protein n=1 Tax=Clostridium sp. KNHs205 TaxID=1449050 RepID=UPI00051AFFB5|nr:homocysteine S-methyltransferase family protein [Clostridium sp. KNHs205]
MTRKEFRELTKQKIVLLDGATGSNMQKAGMPTGVCPEEWILKNPGVLIDLQKAYIEAGTDILYAPTFTGNRIKLTEYGLADRIAEINQELVRLSKRAVTEAAADRKVYIAGDLTMTGQQLYPVGTLRFEELVEVYKEQIAYLLLAGADLFVIETMMSLQECRAALLAVKETCDLPVMITLTFNENNRTLYGTDPVTAITVLQKMGADAVGVNCSTGPEGMKDIVSEMKKYSSVPIIAKPNAGLPKLVNDETVFSMEGKEFAEETRGLVEAGAGIIGGCCGTTPEHLAMLKASVSELPVPELTPEKVRILTTERKALKIKDNGKFLVIGERINPTGKKALQEELRQGNYQMVTDFARQQEEDGADILDVNMGMNGIDEKEAMLEAIYELTGFSGLPLSIDTSHISVMEAALRIYPGRALINSISLEKEKFEKLIPLAHKYGAMFILLPLSDKGLPKDLEEKKDIIRTIAEAAERNGLEKDDIIVDGLVNTVGANRDAALQTLETIRYCKEELGLATVVGLSNISFGLPERQYVNSTFLALAIREGLTMAIANPSQELLMNTAFAADLLAAKEESDIRYIKRVTERPSSVVTRKEETLKKSGADTSLNQEEGAGSPKVIEGNKTYQDVYDAVIKGNKREIVARVKEVLKEEVKPSFVLDELLIPGINEVGRLFDKQIYFLPQLISSAEAMKTAIDYLEPLLKDGQEEKKLATVVIATVSGDVHDIGKNLVVLMLKNYGFQVIDLGKDVPSEKIIETAREQEADIIALSALMTTTMLEMKRVIALKQEAGLKAKVIIGGAVITQSYADEIGADGFAADAGETVTVIKRLLKL